MKYERTTLAHLDKQVGRESMLGLCTDPSLHKGSTVNKEAAL